MKKKNLKWYDAPQVEIVEMETSVSLLAGSDPVTSESGDPNGDKEDGGW